MDKIILIIEDDEAIAQIYKIALTHRNHISEIAIDGVEGVNKAKELIPKLILLDIMMPRKNGFEVIQELKADPTTQNIPVFVLSNLVDLDMIDKMKQAGALKYLVKSQYTPDQIVDIVEEFFKNPSQHSQDEVSTESQTGHNIDNTPPINIPSDPVVRPPQNPAMSEESPVTPPINPQTESQSTGENPTQDEKNPQQVS